MSLGFNRTFGWVSKNIFGSLPPLLTSIRQWLTGVAAGGASLVDKISPLVVDPTKIPSAVPCLAFDGVDGVVDTGTTISDANGVIDWTVDVIFNSLSEYDGLVSQGTFGGSVGLGIASGPVLRGVVRPNGGALVSATGTTVLQTDTPYTLRMVWNGTDTLTTYIDGVVEATTTLASAGTFDAVNLFIGNGFEGVPTTFDGKMFGFRSAGEITYTFEETSGTTRYDSSGNGNHGTHSGGVTHTTAEGIPCKGLEDGFSLVGAVHVPADASDPTKDVLGNELTNPGGYVNNGACDTIEHPDATQLLSSVETCVDGACEYPGYLGDVNGHPSFGTSSTLLSFPSSNWVFDLDTDSPGTDVSTHPTATGIYPKKTGWPNSTSGKTFEVDFETPDIDDDGNRVGHSLAEELAAINGTENVIRQFKKVGPNDTCVMTARVHYNQKVTDRWSESEYNQAVAWANKYGEFGAGMKVILRDVNGDILYDSDGEILFANPE